MLNAFASASLSARSALLRAAGAFGENPPVGRLPWAFSMEIKRRFLRGEKTTAVQSGCRFHGRSRPHGDGSLRPPGQRAAKRNAREQNCANLVLHPIRLSGRSCACREQLTATTGAARSGAERAGVEIRQFGFASRPPTQGRYAGMQFFAGRVRRRDGGATDACRTDSHDPRYTKGRPKRAALSSKRFSFDRPRPFSFAASKRKWGRIPAGNPRSFPACRKKAGRCKRLLIRDLRYKCRLPRRGRAPWDNHPSQTPNIKNARVNSRK